MRLSSTSDVPPADPNPAGLAQDPALSPAPQPARSPVVGELPLFLTGDSHPAWGLERQTARNRKGEPKNDIELVKGANLQAWDVPMVSNDLLRSVGLHIHPVIGILACTVCDVIIPSSVEGKQSSTYLTKHLVNGPHNLDRQAAATTAHAVLQSAGLPPALVLPVAPLAANATLVSKLPHAPAVRGARCIYHKCGWAACAKTSGNKLPHTCASGLKVENAQIVECYVQQIPIHLGPYGLPINEPVVNQHVLNSVAHLHSIVAHHFHTVAPAGDVTFRDLSPIDRRYGWAAKLKGLSPAALALAGRADKGIWEGNDISNAGLLRVYIDAVLKSINLALPGSSGIGERLMAAGQVHQSDQGSRSLNRVSGKTVETYTGHLSSLLLYGLRWSVHPELVPTAMPSSLQSVFDDIRQAIHIKNPGQMGSLLMKAVTAILSFHTSGPEEDEWDSHLMRWLILDCRNADGSFKDAHTITSPMAGLMWCFRAIVYRHLGFELKKPGLSDNEKEAVLSHHCLLVSSNEFRVSGLFLRVKAFIEGIARTQLNPPNCYWRDEPGVLAHDLMSVNGEHTSVTEIQRIVNETLQDCRSKMAALVDGLAAPPESALADIHDTLGSSAVGYSAACDLRNSCAQDREFLVRHMVENPGWAAHVLGRTGAVFHRGKRDDQTDLLWDRGACKELLGQTTAIGRLFAVLVHMVYGSPARGTEFLTVKLVNTAEGPRGWYILGGRVVIVCRWQKTSTMQGGRDTMIPRVLCQQTSALFVLYVTRIRPLEVFLASVIGMAQTKIDNYRQFLFVSMGERVDTSKLSGWIKITGLGASGSPNGGIGVEGWRQLVAFVQDYFAVRIDIDNGHDDSHEVSGFGHSIAIHNKWYGRDNNWIPGVEVRLLDAARHSCNVWHGILGLTSFRPTRPEDGKTVVGGQPSPSPGPGAATSQCALILDNVKEIVTNTIQTAHSVNAPAAEAPPLSAASARLTPLQDVLVPWSRVNDLNRLGLAAFKSTTQAMVAEKIIDRSSDGMYIMPTGSGKTVPYVLAASVIGPNRFIAVCVPFRSLLDNLVNRITSMGVHAWEWSHTSKSRDMAAPAGICLVISDRMADFVVWARGFKAELHALVLEEAHEVVLASTYRPCMANMQRARILGVPSYLCSASIPPAMVNTLLDGVGISTGWLATLPASRPELSYTVYPPTPDKQKGANAVVGIITCWLESQMFGKIGKIIVFCQTRGETVDLAQTLNHRGVGAVAYHAKLDPDVKADAIVRFSTNPMVRVVCATASLGAGIDWDFIMGVIFLGAPSDLLALDQGFGRGGRGAYRSIGVVVPKAVQPWTMGQTEGPSVQEQQVEHWVDDIFTCHRYTLGQCTSGEGSSCAILGDTCMPCDNCLRGCPSAYPPHVPSSADELWTSSRWTDRDAYDVPAFMAKGSSPRLRPGKSSPTASGPQEDTSSTGPCTNHSGEGGRVLVPSTQSSRSPGLADGWRDPLQSDSSQDSFLAAHATSPLASRATLPGLHGSSGMSDRSILKTPTAPGVDSSSAAAWKARMQSSATASPSCPIQSARRAAIDDGLLSNSLVATRLKRPASADLSSGACHPRTRLARSESSTFRPRSPQATYVSSPRSPFAPARPRSTWSPAGRSDQTTPVRSLLVDDQAFQSKASKQQAFIINRLMDGTRHLGEPACSMCWAVRREHRLEHERKLCTLHGLLPQGDVWTATVDPEVDSAEYMAQSWGKALYSDQLKDGSVCYNCWMPLKPHWHKQGFGMGKKEGCKMGAFLGRRTLWATWAYSNGDNYNLIHQAFPTEAHLKLFVNKVDKWRVPGIWRLLAWLWSDYLPDDLHVLGDIPVTEGH